MIKELKICCNNIYKAIPLAFDESLSYLEELSAILHKLNEVVVQTNKNTYFIEHYEDEYDELRKELDDLMIDINNRFITIEADLNQRFIELTNHVLQLIDNNYNILKDYIDSKYEELDYKIEHISIDNIVLRDPTTGIYSNIQVVVNNLFNTFNVDAITASEFDALDLTVTAFENYQITAYEFDTQSKIILV